WPSLHVTLSRKVKVQLMPSSAAFHEAARSGAGFRSLPGLARPPNRTRLTKIDSTRPLGCHGVRVGSAAMGTVTVPPTLDWVGAAAGAVVGTVDVQAASSPTTPSPSRPPPRIRNARRE